MKLIGGKVVHYVSNMETYTKYILCCLSKDNYRKQIIFDKNTIQIKNVEYFNGYTMIPTNFIELPDIEENENFNKQITFIQNLLNQLLLNLHFFKKTIRHKDKRPVWFFQGSSKQAKKFISSNTNISKFLLNKHKFLPDLIECDIIVLSENNSYNFEDIKSRCIGDNEYILVNFEEKITSTNTFTFSKHKFVYLFIGDSNIGKSYIAHSIKNVDIYETDSSINLPNVLTETIIVIGNKYIFGIDDIVNRYTGNYTFIYVEFSKI